ALHDGTCLFDVGDLRPGELFEVATPDGAVDFTQPGLYQVGCNSNGSDLVTVLSGTAQVVGLEGSGRVTRGQVLALASSTAAQAILSELTPSYAGQLVNDYYSERYPDVYDGRYADYNSYIADPNYDPYDSSVSHGYVPDDTDIAGLEDLDRYGKWEDVKGYGKCWAPDEAQGWVPYRQGRWEDDGPTGLTWVSSEAWGWAPYHYGRWASQDGRWFWIPGQAVARPVYSPALVAFVPLRNSDDIAWVPLGPADPYVPSYYGSDLQPRYLAPAQVIDVHTTIVNLEVPGAVTAVPAARFSGVIGLDTVVPVDRQSLTGVRPVFNPFALQPVRRAVVESPIPLGVPRFQVPEAAARQAIDRPVITSATPILPAVVSRTAAANMARVQTVSAKQIRQQLKVNNSGRVVASEQGASAPPAAGQATGQNMGQQPPLDAQTAARMQALQAKAARGDQQAARRLERLQQQQAQRQQQPGPQAAQAQQEAAQAARQHSEAAQMAQQEASRQQAAAEAARQTKEQAARQQAAAQAAAARTSEKEARRQAAAQAAEAARVKDQAARQQAQALAAAKRAQQESAQHQAAAAAAVRAQEKAARRQQAAAQAAAQAQQEAARQQAAAAQRAQAKAARRQAAAQQSQHKVQTQAQPQPQSSQTKAERKAERRAQDKNRNSGQ
ncbi:MAG TPA: DUF6600 domain-containing protein, partial [Blastocatellia bacterium]|nr:DUF6600 domain-containing protein [Blastocatellia bacterium]